MTVRPLCCSKEQEMVLLHRVTVVEREGSLFAFLSNLQDSLGGGAHFSISFLLSFPFGGHSKSSSSCPKMAAWTCVFLL